MESYKVLVSIALFAACVFAAQAAEPTSEEPITVPAQVPLPLAPFAEKDAPLNRAKKHALFPFAYSAYPYYSYYPAAYPYSYSYQYYDDGKYYPGKYEKPYYRSYNPYYYPYY